MSITNRSKLSQQLRDICSQASNNGKAHFLCSQPKTALFENIQQPLLKTFSDTAFYKSLAFLLRNILSQKLFPNLFFGIKSKHDTNKNPQKKFFIGKVSLA